MAVDGLEEGSAVRPPYVVGSDHQTSINGTVRCIYVYDGGKNERGCHCLSSSRMCINETSASLTIHFTYGVHSLTLHILRFVPKNV